MNDGILTQAGISAWLGRTKKLVHEFDTGVASATQSAKMTLFANDSRTKAMSEAGGLTLVGNATELGTTMVKQGKFSVDRFTATHLGLEVLPVGVYNETAANDKVAGTIQELNVFIYRAFFQWYFNEGNEPAAEGIFHEFPWGRGLTVPNSTAAVTLVTNGVLNGAPGELGAPMPSPVDVTVDTAPRLDITFPKGAVATTVEMFIRGHVLGFTG